MAIQAGDPLHFAVAFTVDGEATDPTTVSLVVMDPDGNETTYTYAGSTVTKDSVGRYSKTLTAVAGWYFWRWSGTGTCQAVDEGGIQVAPSLV